MPEGLEEIEIEDRLGDDILRARLYLPGEAPQLLVHVGRAGIGSHADQQSGLRTCGIAADIHPLIELVHDIGEADGIDVEDRRRIGIGSHARRVAGNADQVAHAGSVCAQQLRLHAQNIAIAATEVEHRFNPGMLLNQLARHLRA
jgi:hypothetical protein